MASKELIALSEELGKCAFEKMPLAKTKKHIKKKFPKLKINVESNYGFTVEE